MDLFIYKIGQEIKFNLFMCSGTVTSFIKRLPPLVPYQYGFRVTLYTYCLIIVSPYRMGNPLETCTDRLYSIAIGAFVAVSVNVLICPAWAGEKLHEELADNFDLVADSLEGNSLIN